MRAGIKIDFDVPLAITVAIMITIVLAIVVASVAAAAAATAAIDAAAASNCCCCRSSDARIDERRGVGRFRHRRAVQQSLDAVWAARPELRHIDGLRQRE